MVTLEDAKIYLKVESHEEDDVISILLEASQQLCQDIVRASNFDSEILDTAVLYGVAYLYEHREEAHHKELKETLYHLLLADRKEVF